MLGQKIGQIHTINSMYANNYMEVAVNGQYLYRLHASEILKIVNEFEFEEVKKKKYIHLTVKRRLNEYA